MACEIRFYSKDNCPLCDEAYEKLKELRDEMSEAFSIQVIDIYQDEALIEKYGLMIPVVEIDGEEVDYGMISKELVRERLQAKSQG